MNVIVVVVVAVACCAKSFYILLIARAHKIESTARRVVAIFAMAFASACARSPGTKFAAHCVRCSPFSSPSRTDQCSWQTLSLSAPPPLPPPLSPPLSLPARLFNGKRRRPATDRRTLWRRRRLWRQRRGHRKLFTPIFWCVCVCVRGRP